MKVKWTNIIAEVQGSVDKEHYARRIPGSGEWAAVCTKPALSDETRKKKAGLPVAKNFKTLITTCKTIMNDASVRAMWQARYDEAKRQASKHNKPIQGRLCDYVRHEVSEAMKRGEKVYGIEG